MKRILALLVLLLIIISPILAIKQEQKKPINFRPMSIKYIAPTKEETCNVKNVMKDDIATIEPVVQDKVELANPTLNLTDDEIYLIALVTVAEAEGECEEGKRMVVDVILNRLDHPNFPNTVYDVIYQPKQFTSMTGSRVERCVVTDDFIRIVKEELENRYNYEAIFFRNKYYHNFGTPLVQVGNHYFSTY